MTDISAFLEWLRSCDSRFAVRAMDYHASWQGMIRHREGGHEPGPDGEFIIDGRYRVIRRGPDMALYNLLERTEHPLAIYQTYGAMMADLIAHSIRRTDHTSPEAFTAEVMRLAGVCEQSYRASLLQ